MTKSKYSLPAILFIIILLHVLFPSITSFFNSSVENGFQNLKGMENPDSNIVIIHINSEDIEKLGGWPLKRSYYALIVQKLSDLKVKKIGLEIFLSKNFSGQQIYNKVLSNSIEGKNNIVLASLADNVSLDEGKYYADSLLRPDFGNRNIQLLSGHLNFIEDNGIVIPSEISYQGSNEYSFSAQLSDLINDEDAIKINFISKWQMFKNYSLIEFFNVLDFDGKNLRGKWIIIGVSDPLISKSINATFNSDLPGIGVHAFALDNILNGRSINFQYLRLSSFLFYFIILVYFIFGKPDLKVSVLSLFLTILIFYLLWNYLYLQLDYFALIFPLFMCIAFQLYSKSIENKELLTKSMQESLTLKGDLTNKESVLAELRKELDQQKVTPSEALLLKIENLEKEISELKTLDKEDSFEYGNDPNVINFEGIIYISSKIAKVVDIVKKVAPENASVLIVGESGSGKELVANAIHKLSKRKDRNFVAVNCAALPDNLLESELFGHLKGAFTDAVADKSGRFEEADKGTLFLDEIGETNENFQSKLLRVLQTGDFQKVGSSKTERVDVRVVAATNKNLDQLIKEKKFREDLYYRLNVIKIELPPLEERKEDIPILANHFVKVEAEDMTISKAVMKRLIENSWKGNIRELESVIKRAAIFAKSEERRIIKLKDLPESLSKLEKGEIEVLVIESLREKNFSHSSINETADELGNISRTIVSENFRGLFFKYYTENSFDIEKTVKSLTISEDAELNDRVKSKINTYLSNIEKDLRLHPSKSFEDIKPLVSSKYKNLPQKYHIYLDSVIKKIIIDLKN